MSNFKSALCVFLSVLTALLLSGCERNDNASRGASSTASASPLGSAECAACSMVVRAQPSPRGQVVYRDGSRRFYCSVGDMVLALQEPSSRGKPTAIFVEALDPGIDPAVTQTTEGRWIPAPQAAFVLGVKRRGVMGPPTVAYANTDAAQQVAKQHGGSVHGWNQLVEQIVSGAAKR